MNAFSNSLCLCLCLSFFFHLSPCLPPSVSLSFLCLSFFFPLSLCLPPSFSLSSSLCLSVFLLLSLCLPPSVSLSSPSVFLSSSVSLFFPISDFLYLCFLFVIVYLPFFVFFSICFCLALFAKVELMKIMFIFILKSNNNSSNVVRRIICVFVENSFF